MGCTSKRLLALIAICLFAAGCEVVGTYVMVVSGPDCGTFDPPAGIEEISIDITDWDRIDESLEVLQPYEHTHNPDILYWLGYLHVRKGVILSDDPGHYRQAVHYFTWAAMCGQKPAVLELSGLYNLGWAGLEKDPKRGACLKKAYDPHRDDRALIPGRVWACGLRMEEVAD